MGHLRVKTMPFIRQKGIICVTKSRHFCDKKIPRGKISQIWNEAKNSLEKFSKLFSEILKTFFNIVAPQGFLPAQTKLFGRQIV